MQVLVIPSSAFPFCFYTVLFSLIIFKQCQRYLRDAGEVTGRIVFLSVIIFIKCYIQLPMQIVFYTPMRAYGLADCLCIKLQGRNEISCLFGRYISIRARRLSGGFQTGKGFQSFPILSNPSTHPTNKDYYKPYTLWSVYGHEPVPD